MTESPVWGAVIVAAGYGTRFGGPVPKQFADLMGMKVIDHSISVFRGVADNIVVVLPADGSAGKWWTPPDDVQTVPGGERRQDSVRSGIIRSISEGATHVLVHDGARPAVDKSLLFRVMDRTLVSGACIPCIPVSDTVKRVTEGSVTETVDRSELQLAQTPQGFRADIILSALDNAEDVTDEASALEKCGIPIAVVKGSRRNVKITSREDMSLIRSFSGVRRTVSGTGLDFHPFAHLRPLIVCGCRLSETNGLQGHSDGDVVLHAIADAILSAARLGDIGTLFPPGDPKWKDADSSVLLKDCYHQVYEKGWEIEHLDVTVIGERPRISPNRELFIETLSYLLGVPEEKIWIKGTTTNSLGDIGRGLGIGCLALAELVEITG